MPRLWGRRENANEGKTMERRKKHDKMLFPDDIPGMVPVDFVNLNRIRFSYKCGKVQVTLAKTFPAENLKYLENIRRLDSVTFEHGGIVNAAILTSLAPLNLRYLKIGVDNQCTDKDLAALENWKGLERLNLHCSHHVTNKGLASLQQLERLTHLYIYMGCNQGITEEGWVPLAHLKHLEKLCFRGSNRITGKEWQYFGQPMELQELTIGGRWHWTDSGVEVVARWCSQLPQLKTLTLGGYGCTDDDNLAHLEYWLGGTLEYRGTNDETPCYRNGYYVKWTRDLQMKIFEFMEQVQSPLSLSVINRHFRVSERETYPIIKRLISEGVVKTFESDEEMMYQTKDPWDNDEGKVWVADVSEEF